MIFQVLVVVGYSCSSSTVLLLRDHKYEILPLHRIFIWNAYDEMAAQAARLGSDSNCITHYTNILCNPVLVLLSQITRVTCVLGMEPLHRLACGICESAAPAESGKKERNISLWYMLLKEMRFLAGHVPVRFLCDFIILNVTWILMTVVEWKLTHDWADMRFNAWMN